MKVLAATRRTQGAREDDCCWADEEELVMSGFECDTATCACQRSLFGVETLRATTTFMIVERADLTPAALETLVLRALGAGGWISTAGGSDAALKLARSLVREIERQIRTMELQARKAERYRAVKAELKEKELAFAFLQREAFNEVITGQESQLAGVENRLAEHLAALHGKEAEGEALQLSLMETDREIGVQQENVYQRRAAHRIVCVWPSRST